MVPTIVLEPIMNPEEVIVEDTADDATADDARDDNILDNILNFSLSPNF
jgi:hypothetical protein